ncbi:hypothetical protein [Agrilutibacter solisilvae]|uniref:Uncharacterized protein n=1 Tax=Agrilutibacter solisilvae TaxID=2763317 RepID=A0A974XZE9_9GAMM|nr:hypothetical protein [Lysobacter solisilvae]QSX78611.1 hypothetical protein I8J32_001310 [Lysobacter solisilvae]
MDRDPYAAPDSGPPPQALAAAAPAFTPLLLRAMLATIGGLLVGGLLLVAAMVAYSAMGPAQGQPVDDPVLLGFFAVLIGGLPLLLVGAPGYALLVRWGRASVPSVALLGAAPGLMLRALGVPAGLVLMVLGVVVALAAHALFRWQAHRAKGKSA